MPQSDQFQFIRLPDGSYGRFKADATTEQIRAAVLKDFPNAYGQQAQPITDTTTIGPKKTFSNIVPTTPSPGISGMLADKLGLTEAARAGSQLFNASNPIEGYNAQGRAENPTLSRLGDITASLKELLFGGQSAGKPMGTRSGLVNNPVTSSMAVAPGTAESLSNITQLFNRRNELLTRILRGPGSYGDVTVNPATMATREFENALPRAEKPWTPQQIAEQRDKGLTEQAEALVRRGKEQEALDAEHAKRLKDAESYRQKELVAAERLKEQDAAARMRRGSEPEGEEAAGVAGAPGTPGGGQDLITRTRALVKPGEQPTAADLKRAGDLTQAPIARLRLLQKYGDKLAENEINRRLQNTALGAVGPLTAAVPQLASNGTVKYANTSTQQLSPMRGFPTQGANIESPSGKKISYFASAGSPKPPQSGTLGEMAYDDKKGHLLAWNGTKWVEADDANRQAIRNKISDERAHLVGEYFKGGHLTKDQVMIFARQKLIGTKDARRILNGPQEESP